jgi:hypothetical protein
VFRAGCGPDQGLRSLTRQQLDTLCTEAKCTIVSSTHNSYIDSYVLSESSLFIYKHRYIMKVCTSICRGYLRVLTCNLDVWNHYSAPLP